MKLREKGEKEGLDD